MPTTQRLTHLTRPPLRTQAAGAGVQARRPRGHLCDAAGCQAGGARPGVHAWWAAWPAQRVAAMVCTLGRTPVALKLPHAVRHPVFQQPTSCRLGPPKFPPCLQAACPRLRQPWRLWRRSASTLGRCGPAPGCTSRWDTPQVRGRASGGGGQAASAHNCGTLRMLPSLAALCSAGTHSK